jgi:hypothetical protein
VHGSRLPAMVKRLVACPPRSFRAFTRRLRPFGGALLVACALGAFGLLASASSQASPERGAGGPAGGGRAALGASAAGVARRGRLPRSVVRTRPTELHLQRARSAVFDVRRLRGTVVRRERPGYRGLSVGRGSAGPSGPSAVGPSASAPAPGPDESFDGLDFATWGQGHPPDPNGDVGPKYYVQTINSSIGIFDKSTGGRVAAFTFNAFMSQGRFGNLCDTDNFGDPVVLYDSFEDRWFITDFAFKLDAGGNISPQQVFQCFAVSKSGDPVTGGWNFYSIQAPGGVDDYPKFGVWSDGIYMSANMFGYGANAAFMAPHVWAIDKAEMYAGAPTVQVVDFAAPAADFTVLPANARLQAGTPPSGTPEYFVSTWEFLNALTVYKFHVDWNRISRSTFTGPDAPLNSTSWPNAAVPNAQTPGNSLDPLQIRAMAQAQYSNIGGVESLWAAHTVRRQNTAGVAAPRWYQVNVTGGTVAPNTVQGATWDPDGANTSARFLPAIAVDRAGDLAMGYSRSNATTNPAIDYAGRLASDPTNTFSQGEQTLIAGTGTQTGTCGSSTCTRWGDYSGMALDPDGCEFWMTNEYYAVNGLNFLTRIGSFHFPGCTTAGSGTLSGTVTAGGGNTIAGATVSLGSRTTTTDAGGRYAFTIPAGTYPSLSASEEGFGSASVADVAVPDGGTATRDFSLSAAPASGCFTDDTLDDFQAGTANGCDLTSNPGTVQLSDAPFVDQSNASLGTSGVGITTTTWGGQTFIPGSTGQLTKVDVNLFCSGCTGTTPDLTLSLRATSGGLPTGADLASATITGFGNGGTAAYHTATFASPITVTAGTQYAFVIRPTANPSPGTYALTRSGTATAGSNVYAGGTRVAGATSGTVWSIPLTGGVSTDAGFNIWLQTGFGLSGTFVSSVKDANPGPGSSTQWKTLSFAATTPAGTGVKFQVAASNSSSGPFTFVGPDGTAGTFFTTSGADLSQFDGFRYLKYEAFLSSTDSSATPSIQSVQICFADVVTTSLAVAPATGVQGGTVDLSATLTRRATGEGVSGKTIDFTLGGTGVGSAVTGADGTATLSNVPLTGITAGIYPGAIAASFIGDEDDGPSSDSNTLTVLTPATVSPSPASWDFGGQRVGTTGGAKTFTITNPGEETLAITDASLGGTSPGEFVESADTCSGAHLATGDTCTVDIAFQPSGTGAEAASLDITSNARSSVDHLGLSGTGIQPAVSPSPGSKDFGEQRVGTQSAAQTFTITNSGTDTLNLATVALGGSDAGQYVESNDGCDHQAIAPDDTCTVDVAFKPTATGAHNAASLDVTSDAPSSVDHLGLSGTGIQPAVSPSPGSKDFGEQRVGTQSAAHTFTITNSGTDTLDVATVALGGADAGQYVESNDHCDHQAIAPNDTCTVDVAFKPTGTGAATASLDITSDAPSSVDHLGLSGTGIQPAVSPSPGSKDFGDQRVGTQSAAQTFTITNSGTDTLDVATVALAGSDAGQYVESNDQCDHQALAPNDTCTVDVAFKPTGTGAATASLDITSDAPTSVDHLALHGNGTPTPPTASLLTPPDGASYTRGQVVAARYSCEDSPGAPGLRSCVAPVADGSPIDTATDGQHAFTVTALSQDGLSSVVTHHYTVVAPPPSPSPSPTPSPSPSPSAVMRVRAPSLSVFGRKGSPARCRMESGAIRACTVRLLHGRRVLARGQASASGQGTGALTVRLKLTKRGRAMLADHLGGVRGRVAAVGTTSDGTRSAQAPTRAILAVEHFTTPPGSWMANRAALSTRGRRFLRSQRARLIDVAALRCDGYSAKVRAESPNAARISLARAAVACAALNQEGSKVIPTLVGHGDSRPIASNTTPAGRARNRRVDVTVTHHRAVL